MAAVLAVVVAVAGAVAEVAVAVAAAGGGEVEVEVEVEVSVVVVVVLVAATVSTGGTNSMMSTTLSQVGASRPVVAQRRTRWKVRAAPHKGVGAVCNDPML